MSKVKKLIVEKMAEVAEQIDSELVGDINDDTILLESGLSSLGFAILVAQLEEDLGFDPFSESEEIIYPRTLKEFVVLYEK